MVDEKWIAIGDIHGCPSQLMEIIEASKQFPNHQIVFLGDYIDRGPQPEEVIETVRSTNAVFLRGNHEQMLLDRIEIWKDIKTTTLKFASLSESSLNWIIENTISKFETGEYVFVHGGLNTSKKLSEQSDRDFMWSVCDGDYSSQTDKRVVHGHLVVPDVVKVGNRINVNTGCGCGGYLTGLVLPEMEVLRSSVSPGHDANMSRYRELLNEEVEEI